MELFNSLTKRLEKVEAHDDKVRIYSCGPTVYERAHIGNLASFIYADTLRRALEADGYKVEHVMNITDVDDKTIKNSHEQYPDLPPMEALVKLTSHYEQVFKEDLEAVGVDIEKIKFVRATENIAAMQELIKDLLVGGVAYETDDGVYFSIDEYQKRGKKYGQLVEINAQNTSKSRIDNDEYDKENPNDFVLWKAKKEGEPAWDFEVSGKNIAGRPGWHIECSAMSTKYLEQPFEIHTGGVDLKFPHHENEIAQSTALNGDLLAKIFFHSEHMLIDNQKMSKSLNNFLTLEDIKEKGFDPLAFRLLVLEGKYNNRRDFTLDNLRDSQNRLDKYRNLAARRHQPTILSEYALQTSLQRSIGDMRESLSNDLNTLEVLENIESEIENIEHSGLVEGAQNDFSQWLDAIDKVLGIQLLHNSSDISEEIKKIIADRQEARQNQDWQKSDELRKKLEEQGIGVNDTPTGPVWYRL